MKQPVPETIRHEFSPVPFTTAFIRDSFWSPRLSINWERTLPTEYRQIKETGWIDAFRLDWKPNPLYQAKPLGCRKTALKAVPYYAWDNREPGAMQDRIME